MIKDYTNSPILVTGAARSGTSMIGASFHLCGAWKGDTGRPSRWNAKGMFENLALREKVVKPILRKMEVDPRGQYPLPETKNIYIPQNFKDTVIKTIKSQGWTKDQPWVYKCAKMSLIWPIWQYAFPNSKWIIVRRNPCDIISSCMRTGFMNSFANEAIQEKVKAKNEYEGWQWWVNRHEDKFVEILSMGINAKVVWPERMINADYAQMKDTIEWAGLRWNGPAVMDFIEPKLWKVRE